jgi:hypothetical protein
MTTPRTASNPSPSLSQQQVVDTYFMEHRAKLLDIAAFLDRVERAGGAADDVRTMVLRRAIGILLDGKPERARRVLELMSDPTADPIAKAGTKGAVGVWPESGSERPAPDGRVEGRRP